MPDLLRVVSTLALSAIPSANDCKNNFHFWYDEPDSSNTEAAAIVAADLVQAFFADVQPGALRSLSSYLADSFPRVGAVHRIEVYHYAASGRTGSPIHERNFEIDAAADGADIPADSQINIQYHAPWDAQPDSVIVNQGGVDVEIRPRARHRGRIKIGRCNSAALEETGRVADQAVNDCYYAMQWLWATAPLADVPGGVGDLEFVVYSKTWRDEGIPHGRFDDGDTVYPPTGTVFPVNAHRVSDQWSTLRKRDLPAGLVQSSAGW